MAEPEGNQTPDTPEVSEEDLRAETVANLREEAKDAGLDSTSQMKKDQLVEEVARVRSRGGEGDAAATGTGGDVGAGPDGGEVRTGEQTSRSLKYSQEVISPDDEPERPGRSLVTTHHQVIREWAEVRGGTPATVPGTEHDDHLGVLRISFSDDPGKLREASWEEWFKTFDDRRLNFIYQEQSSDGDRSNFFRLESPDREDG